MTIPPPKPTAATDRTSFEVPYFAIGILCGFATFPVANNFSLPLYEILLVASPVILTVYALKSVFRSQSRPGFDLIRGVALFFFYGFAMPLWGRMMTDEGKNDWRMGLFLVPVVLNILIPIGRMIWRHCQSAKIESGSDRSPVAESEQSR
jgi:hypothetical protein